MIDHLDHLVLTTAHEAECVRFYTEVLGMVGKILSTAEVRRKAEDSGTAVEVMTPAQLGEFTKKELDYWGRVIQGARITLE